MKQPGNYYDHPTLGLMRVPNTMMLNRDEYEYHPDLGFIKKLYKKTLGKVMKPVEKAARKLVPKEIRKLVPNELKGNILKPAALAAGGYGLYTMGAGGIAAGAKSVGGALATGAGKVGSGLLAAGKVAAPILVAGATQAGKVGTAVMEQAPALLALQQQANQQKAQAQISQIETEAHLQALQLQRQHEHDMMRIQLEQMRAGSSIPPQSVVWPGASAPQGSPAMSFSMPGQTGSAAGGINLNMMLIAGAGVLAAVLLTGRK